MNDLVTEIDIHNAIAGCGAERHPLTMESLRKAIFFIAIADLATMLNFTGLVIRAVFNGWEHLRKTTSTETISAGWYSQFFLPRARGRMAFSALLL